LELWQLVAFVRSLNTEAPSAAEHGPAAEPPYTNVPYTELAKRTEGGEDWLTFAGSYSSWRYSSQTQIKTANVGQMALRWLRQFDVERGEMEVSPLVRNGVMFITEPPNRIISLNAATGKTYWTYEHKLPAGFAAVGELPSLAVPNRGVALLDDRVFVGTADARLVALSALTGLLQWETPVGDPAMYFIDSAPLAYRDLVVTGVGTRGGGQGFVVALDAKTGKERWRFVVIPKPGQPGSQTWAGTSGLQGGGPTWLTGSYDPDLDLLIWAVGNPKPDYDSFKRTGDNLYTDSAIALRGTTGSLVWHFQFTPADDHDWDANQMPVLVDHKTPQGVDKHVLWANRNGFYYVLNRETGQFVTAAPFVRQTWTSGMDADGRPQLLPHNSPTREGFLIYPGNSGATNWWSPSYNPQLDLMFVPSLEQGMVYFASAGSYPVAPGGQKFYTAVRAIAASTGKIVWENRRPPRSDNSITGGVLSTATGLVFGGDDSTFFALDAGNGRTLWSVETGGKINASPVTYSANGEQFVVVAAGRNLLAFAIPARPSITQ
jgi:alcohol dehydrogenase (cytochrome c)